MSLSDSPCKRHTFHVRAPHLRPRRHHAASLAQLLSVSSHSHNTCPASTQHQLSHATHGMTRMCSLLTYDTTAPFAPKPHPCRSPTHAPYALMEPPHKPCAPVRTHALPSHPHETPRSHALAYTCSNPLTPAHTRWRGERRVPTVVRLTLTRYSAPAPATRSPSARRDTCPASTQHQLSHATHGTTRMCSLLTYHSPFHTEAPPVPKPYPRTLRAPSRIPPRPPSFTTWTFLVLSPRAPTLIL